MLLIQKLDEIRRPPIQMLSNGSANTIEEFWTTFIEPRLPKRDIMLLWHN